MSKGRADGSEGGDGLLQAPVPWLGHDGAALAEAWRSLTTGRPAWTNSMGAWERKWGKAIRSIYKGTHPETTLMHATTSTNLCWPPSGEDSACFLALSCASSPALGPVVRIGKEAGATALMCNNMSRSLCTAGCSWSHGARHWDSVVPHGQVHSAYAWKQGLLVGRCRKGAVGAVTLSMELCKRTHRLNCLVFRRE